jgi:hypothetical protein
VVVVGQAAAAQAGGEEEAAARQRQLEGVRAEAEGWRARCDRAEKAQADAQAALAAAQVTAVHHY